MADHALREALSPSNRKGRAGAEVSGMTPGEDDEEEPASPPSARGRRSLGWSWRLPSAARIAETLARVPVKIATTRTCFPWRSRCHRLSAPVHI